MSERTVSQSVREINRLHFEANPSPPDPVHIARCKQERDRLIALLKAQGKHVLLVRSESYEECGRYVCEDYDGVNGYDPLPGTVTVEEMV